jgi:thiol-disulfide isomerase/thioredoxin
VKLVVPAIALSIFCLAQTPPAPFSPIGAAAESARLEQEDLNRAMTEASGGTVDMTRALEGFLKKYPNTVQRLEIERMLGKAAIENKDDVRVIEYGKRVLANAPDDVLMLDRVSSSLIALGGRERMLEAIQYARRFEDIIDKLPVVTGQNAPQTQDDRDRATARSLIYQTRAHMALGETDEALRLIARAFDTYPNAENAREWANVLIRAGRSDEALSHLTDAFAIPDIRAAEADRQADRLKLGELYAKKHGSEKGLGDSILASFDHTSTLVETHRKKVLALDPNSGAQSLLDFTITGLDGKKLQLQSLKGKVVVLDFWATWCEPCRVQHPMYEELKTFYSNRNDIAFLNLNSDEDHEPVPEFILKQKWDRHVYFEDGLARMLQVTGIPTTVVLDRNGKVASRMNGFLPDTFMSQLKERINDALAQRQ